MFAQRLTKEDLDRGFVVCGCGKYAHVMKAEVLRKLGPDVKGECCKECRMFMLPVEALKKAGLLKEGEA